MKRHSPPHMDLTISGEDVSAILDALPLIPIFGAETEVQQNINVALCRSVIEKMEKQEKSADKAATFDANETRIIGLTVIAARDVLSGDLPMDLDAALMEKLRRHFFTYNRLAAVYGPLLGFEQ